MERKWIKNTHPPVGKMVEIKMTDRKVHKDAYVKAKYGYAWANYVDRYVEAWRPLPDHEYRDDKSADIVESNILLDSAELSIISFVAEYTGRTQEKRRISGYIVEVPADEEYHFIYHKGHGCPYPDFESEILCRI